MKILVFTEGTITVHPQAKGLCREEIVQQSLNRNTNDVEIEDYKNYILLGNPRQKLASWKKQGADILYLTSRTKPKEIDLVRETLKKYELLDYENLFFRENNENYAEVAERLMPDNLRELQNY